MKKINVKKWRSRVNRKRDRMREMRGEGKEEGKDET
jgi:hypothetical protein